MQPDKFIVETYTLPCQHIRGYYRSTATSQEEELLLEVKKYVPKGNPEPRAGDVTIIAAHCAGMFKELYEPLFNQLISLSESPSSKFRIRAIWIADLATHGASAALNEGKLGVDLSWDDHARDLLHMTNVFRQDMIRPIVGFGHSAGGTMITRLAAMHPRLFASLLLIEPAISKEYSPAMNYAPTYFMSYRKDVWPSLEDAFKETSKIGAQRYWDAEVLHRWHDYGFRHLPTLQHPSKADGVTLATTKHHGARAYARAVHPEPGKPLLSIEVNHRTHPDVSNEDIAKLKQPAYAPTAIAAFRDLPYLLPSALFVYGEIVSTAASRLDNRECMLPLVGSSMGGSGGMTANKVKEVVLDKSGHFVPFEKPQAVAEVCNEWLQQQLPIWCEEERLNAQEWDRRGDARDKATLDQEWMWWAKETYAKKSKI
ncbi:hypothetical protein AMS68_002069 [Peltaster fructicola]|uniref:AB hydrolase-1 domain-containing protein n=1 Tax=Peltaster fructicola TaxID=286661 RepID=A0A6H0XP64_9PEZI|nr:hypothetical protein AMS68_002069 [Peltaster fructicola]